MKTNTQVDALPYKLSTEACDVLRTWIRDEAVPAVMNAHQQRPNWFAREHHRSWPAKGNESIVVANGEHVLDLVHRIEVIAAEAGYDLTETHEDSPYVEDETADDGHRVLTQREVVDLVKHEAATALKESELLAAERKARAERKALRNKPEVQSATEATAATGDEARGTK